jgi:hypothetical protein
MEHKGVMELENRDFKGVWIPKEIWLSKELNVMEKLFLVEIDSLDNESGCYASNSYFAEFFQLSRNRCSEIIKSLEAKKLIMIEYIREQGKQNIEKRVIKVVEKPNTPIRKTDRPIRKIEGGYSEKCEENNTVFNNTINNLNNIYSVWNESKIIVHQKITREMEKAYKKVSKDYSEEEIITAIKNYSEILNESDWFNYKWTLSEFLTRGLSKFTDWAVCSSNYLSKNQNMKGAKNGSNSRDFEQELKDAGIGL